MTLDYEALRNGPRVSVYVTGLSDEVQKERTKERQRRAALARQRAYQALGRAYPEDFRTLFNCATREVNDERGSLPGDPDE